MQTTSPESRNNAPAEDKFQTGPLLPTQGKSLTFKILGDPGRDNAAFVTLDTGKGITRFLFDCGAGCLGALDKTDIQNIDYVFFSHLHMDHISGFDELLRHTYARAEKPVIIFGPEKTAQIIQKRLQGVLWDRTANLPGEYQVFEIVDGRMKGFAYKAAEGFSVAHSLGSTEISGTILDDKNFQVRSVALDHGTTSMAYVVRQKSQLSVNTTELSNLQLKPGPWLARLKDPSVPDSELITLNDKEYTFGDLRQQLLIEKRGESIAYVTDFLPSSSDIGQLIAELQDCDTVICENNYRSADAELATKNFHATSADVGKIAKEAHPGQVVLFHLSDRYRRDDWKELIEEVRAEYPKTYFPQDWLDKI